MINRIFVILGYAVLAADAAALAFLMASWIRDRRNAYGSAPVQGLQRRKGSGAGGR